MDGDRPLQPHELVAEGLGGAFPNVAAPLPTPPLSATEELEDMALSSNDFSLTKMRAADDPNPATYTTDVDVTSTLSDGRTIQLAVANVPQPYSDALAKGVVPPPPAPEPTSASEITSTAFRFTWAAIPYATDYIVDAALDADFAVNAPDWRAHHVGNVLSVSVGPLTAATDYYMRVRCVVGGQEGANSEVRLVSTTA